MTMTAITAARITSRRTVVLSISNFTLISEFMIKKPSFKVPGSKFQVPSAELRVASCEFVVMHLTTHNSEIETRNSELETTFLFVLSGVDRNCVAHLVRVLHQFCQRAR